jgi:hypothetical protein
VDSGVGIQPTRGRGSVGYITNAESASEDLEQLGHLELSDALGSLAWDKANDAVGAASRSTSFFFFPLLSRGLDPDPNRLSD